MKKLWKWLTHMFKLFGSYSHDEDVDLCLVLDRENKALKAENEGLQRTCNALIESSFGDFADEDRDINWLMAQFGAFFVNSSLNRFELEEFYFLRKTFLQAIATAYKLGLQKCDRVAKEVK